MREIFDYLDMREKQLLAYKESSYANSDFADYDTADGSLHFLVEIREFLKLKDEKENESQKGQ